VPHTAETMSQAGRLANPARLRSLVSDLFEYARSLYSTGGVRKEVWTLAERYCTPIVDVHVSSLPKSVDRTHRPVDPLLSFSFFFYSRMYWLNYFILSLFAHGIRTRMKYLFLKTFWIPRKMLPDQRKEYVEAVQKELETNTK
jgi:hypothetical protein